MTKPSMTKPATLAPSSWGCPATLAGDRGLAAYSRAAARARRLFLEALLAAAVVCWGAAYGVADAAAAEMYTRSASLR